MFFGYSVNLLLVKSFAFSGKPVIAARFLGSFSSLRSVHQNLIGLDRFSGTLVISVANFGSRPVEKKFDYRRKFFIYRNTSTDIMASKPTSSSAANVEGGYAKRAQAKWTPHTNGNKNPQLHLYNSLTRNKDVFEPINGNQVKFYICGPTVYDAAHMGHARAYLSFDILRRVLSNYFNYDVLYVMNITDIDDKIIKRARQNFLYDEYVLMHGKNFNRVAKDAVEALKIFKTKVGTETDADKKKMLDEMAEKAHTAITKVESDLSSLDSELNNSETIGRGAYEILSNTKDIISEWLDNELGSTVKEHSVFSKLARKFENDFLQDMTTLNVLPPDVLTRVGEYVPEIIQYVEGIINNGYAYPTSEGSVYFDTAAFEASPKHYYAKLVYEAFGDQESADKHLKESEGELSLGADKLQEKKSPSDFALWKSSKEGEPFWSSPWGNGRPGWHIECSAMSTAVLGDKLDIHAGVLISSFLIMTMKSLSVRPSSTVLIGSITSCIVDALKTYTSRQLRILFLMHTWTDVLDYSINTMERVVQFENFCNEFFLTVKDYIRKHLTSCSDESDYYKKYSKEELHVLAQFQKLKCGIHAALCDSIDTRTVVEKMREIISLSNVYIRDKEMAGVLPNCSLLKNIAEYISSLLRMFGAIPENYPLGFPTDQNGNSTEDREELIMPYLYALSDFRKNVRVMAKEHKNINILEECDNLRDKVLPQLGVRLEDRSFDETCVKLVDREILIKEMEQKLKLAQDKEAEKVRKQKQKEEQEVAKKLKQELKQKQRDQQAAKQKSKDIESSSTTVKPNS
uniref:Cysteine--tRNA ligase, cytoplasmic n=1 Tax=Ditylenchus dipsaci TaxID=166011 RepID=A0A915CWW8_9BILA